MFPCFGKFVTSNFGFRQLRSRYAEKAQQVKVSRRTASRVFWETRAEPAHPSSTNVWKYPGSRYRRHVRTKRDFANQERPSTLGHVCKSRTSEPHLPRKPYTPKRADPSQGEHEKPITFATAEVQRSPKPKFPNSKFDKLWSPNPWVTLNYEETHNLKHSNRPLPIQTPVVLGCCDSLNVWRIVQQCWASGLGFADATLRMPMLMPRISGKTNMSPSATE